MFHGSIDVETAMGLKALRQRIDRAAIPSSKLDESINIATWNIRDFGKTPRRRVSLHYIAEILHQFDLVGIVELRRDLTDLRAVMDILGPYWKAVYSDYTPDWGGNWERFAFLYDKRAVTFTGLAAEASPPRQKDPVTGEYVAQFSWWRSPFIASFRSGNFDFVLISAHIRWGKKGQDRVEPLKLLAQWVDKRRRDSYGTDKDIIVMGDFNIPALEGALYDAITSRGLRVPEALLGSDHGSNLEKNKRYDQILHYPSESSCFTNNAGALDFYTGGISALYPTQTPSKSAFTYEISDHFPLWIEVRVDIADEKLDQVIRAGTFPFA